MKTDILQTIDTPCYVIDEANLDQSLNGFATALLNQFPNGIASLSVKTNSLPFLLMKAREFGYYAEVVSADEYELALKCGFAKDHIIYNGPLKTRESFIDAIEHGALVNIESFREVEWLAGLDHEKTYSVGVRMNVNITQISPEDQNHDDDNSRFGFSVESSDFDSVLKTLAGMPHVRFERLHIHRTSRTRSLKFYEHLLDYAMQQMSSRGITLKHLDVGGGYFGMMPAKPTYSEYVQTMASTIAKYQPIDSLTLIIEPGNAVVASSFSFVTQVIDVKHHDGANYVTIDGSRIDVDPLFHKCDYFKRIIYSNPTSPVVEKQIIGGCTCLEFDRLMELHNQPSLQAGDRIVIDRVGAYTLCFTPLFIRYWPAVYSLNNDKLVMVRDKWTAKEYMLKSNL